jgi:hypothetical protein
VLAKTLAGLHYVHQCTDDDGIPSALSIATSLPQHFVTYDGAVRVVDFGMARRRFATPKHRPVKGNLAYMAPEAVRSEPSIGERHLLAGRHNVGSGDRAALMAGPRRDAIYRRLATETSHPSARRASGRRMLRIAERALAVDLQRYATAEEMRQELEASWRDCHPTNAVALAAYMDPLCRRTGKISNGHRRRVGPFSSGVRCGEPPQNRDERLVSGIDATQFSTTISSMPPTEETFRATTTLYVVQRCARCANESGRAVHSTRSRDDSARDGRRVCPHDANDTPARAAGTPVAVETATYGEAASTMNHPAPKPPLALEAPLLSPEPIRAASSPARGTISAVFLVRPAHARLFLDGAPLEGNPAGIRRQPDDKPHLLRVEAPGYATLVRAIDLDRDVAKEFELAPQSTPGLAAPQTAPPTGPHDELPKSQPGKRTVVRDDPWGI